MQVKQALERRVLSLQKQNLEEHGKVDLLEKDLFEVWYGFKYASASLDVACVISQQALGYTPVVRACDRGHAIVAASCVLLNCSALLHANA